jgi:monofunctional biosynthetic peptidoglycan transglycosylase
MTDQAKTPRKRKKKPAAKTGASASLPSWSELFRRLGYWLWRAFICAAAAFVVLVVIYAFVNPRLTPYILAERFRENGIERNWVPIEMMAPEVGRSFVASEDANFCNHWGFDMKAIRAAIDEGGGRGASTISQQVTKNVFLWQGRSWLRKALESVMTPVVELIWTKRRILEVYLNIAETGPGIFGVDAAARHYFGVSAGSLTADQAARIAAILPDPKGRNPATNSGFMRRRAAQIRSGAETILADGRAACFED